MQSQQNQPPRLLVLKVGGNELDQPDFLAGLCAALATLTHPNNAGAQQRVVLVHGGGKEISAALEQYGQPVEFIEGLRVTPPASMDIMEMVVCGRINKRLVARLLANGLPALGLSGVDLGLLRCVPHRPDGLDLGRVGMVTAVDTQRLQTMLHQHWLPVLAPVALGQADHLAYNVNADMVALAVAAALAQHPDTPAVELVFISNVPGVLQDNQLIDHLDAAAVEPAIQAGTISGGMIPKVRSALSALQQGVAAVRITNLAGLVSGGTRLSNET